MKLSDLNESALNYIPSVVYHGTPGGEFDQFDTSRKGIASYFGMPVEVTRYGLFFAEDEEFARSFADRNNKTGTVMAFKLNVQNPLILDGVDGFPSPSGWRFSAPVDQIEKLIQAGMDENYAHNHLGSPEDFWEQFDDSNGEYMVEILDRAGFDSVRMQEYGGGRKIQNVWVIFDQTKVKRIRKQQDVPSDDA